jgi:transmembrane sensor
VLRLFLIMERQKKYQSINQSINQSVRSYRVPTSIEKGTALNLLLERIRQAPPAKTKTIQMYQVLRWTAGIAAAAVIVVAFLVFTGRQSIQNNELQAFGYRLPDQSRVVLAAGSKVSFSRNFKDRTVSLNGEGYFEVLKGSSFEVKTSAGIVEVLGTRFSVKESGNNLEVNCYEGSVKVSNRETGRILQPGEGVSLSDKEMVVFENQNNSYPSIALFQAAYSNHEISAVIKDLELFFGISISSQIRESRYYTGKFETGNPEVALTLLCEPLGLNFRKDKNNEYVIY